MEQCGSPASREHPWKAATMKRRAWACSRDSWQAPESQDQGTEEPLAAQPMEEKPSAAEEPGQNKIANWLKDCRTPLGASLDEQSTPSKGVVKHGCSFEDDLSLGAEANHLQLSSATTEAPCYGMPAKDKRSQFKQKGRSMNSTGSGKSSATVSSVSELLDLYEEDPEEILYNLGFGREEPDIASKVPSRFFNSCSGAKGIDIKVYLGAQLQRRELENPNYALTSRFRQTEVLANVANVFSEIYSQVSGRPAQKIGSTEVEPIEPSPLNRNNPALNVAKSLKRKFTRQNLLGSGEGTQSPASATSDPEGGDGPSPGVAPSDSPMDSEHRGEQKQMKPFRKKDSPSLATVTEEANLPSGEAPAPGGGDVPMLSSELSELHGDRVDAPAQSADAAALDGGAPLLNGETPALGGGAPLLNGETSALGEGAALLGGETPALGGGAPLLGGDAPVLGGGPLLLSSDTSVLEGVSGASEKSDVSLISETDLGRDGEQQRAVTSTPEKEPPSSLLPNPHIAHLLTQAKDSFEMEELQSNEDEALPGTRSISRAGSEHFLRTASQQSDSSGFAEDPSTDGSANYLKVQESSDSCDSETTVTSHVGDVTTPLALERPAFERLQGEEERNHPSAETHSDREPVPAAEPAPSAELVPTTEPGPTTELGPTAEVVLAAEAVLTMERSPSVEPASTVESGPVPEPRSPAAPDSEGVGVGSLSSSERVRGALHRAQQRSSSVCEEEHAGRVGVRASDLPGGRGRNPLKRSSSLPSSLLGPARVVSSVRIQLGGGSVTHCSKPTFSYRYAPEDQEGGEAESIVEVEEDEGQPSCRSTLVINSAEGGSSAGPQEGEDPLSRMPPYPMHLPQHLTRSSSSLHGSPWDWPHRPLGQGYSWSTSSVPNLPQHTAMSSHLPHHTPVHVPCHRGPYGSPYHSLSSASLNSPFSQTPSAPYTPLQNSPFFQPPHSAPFTQQPHSVPFAQLPHSAPFTQQPHSVPFTQLPHSAPFTQQPHSVPFTQLPHNAPFTQQPHSAPFTQLPHGAPFTPQSHSAPFTQLPHSAPCTQQPHSAPFTQQPHSAPFIQQPHSAPFNSPYNPQLSGPYSSSFNSLHSSPYNPHTPLTHTYSLPYHTPPNPHTAHYSHPYHQPFSGPSLFSFPYEPTPSPAPSSTEMQLRRVLHDIRGTVQSLAQGPLGRGDETPTDMLSPQRSVQPPYEELQMRRRSLNVFRTQMMDLELALMKQQSLVYQNLSQEDRQEAEQLQRLRSAVRRELQELEQQLEERLLSLSQPLRSAQHSSLYRHSMGIHRGYSMDSLSSSPALRAMEPVSDLLREQLYLQTELGYDGGVSAVATPSSGRSSGAASPVRPAGSPERSSTQRAGLYRTSICLTPAPPPRPGTDSPQHPPPPERAYQATSGPAPEEGGERGPGSHSPLEGLGGRATMDPHLLEERGAGGGRGGEGGGVDNPHLKQLIKEIKDSIADEIRQEIVNELLAAVSPRKSPVTSREHPLHER